MANYLNIYILYENFNLYFNNILLIFIIYLKLLHHIAETQNLRRVQVIARCVADEGHFITTKRLQLGSRIHFNM